MDARLALHNQETRHSVATFARDTTQMRAAHLHRDGYVLDRRPRRLPLR